MDSPTQELLIKRIISGTANIYLDIEDKQVHLTFRKPTLAQLYRAEELYHETLKEGLDEGLLSEKGLLEFMEERGFWDKGDQETLNKVKEDLDDFKVKLWESILIESQLRAIRELLGRARAKLAELEGRRSEFNHISAAGYANSVKSRYILGCSLYKGKRPLFRKELYFWNDSNDILERAGQEYFKRRINEGQYRELARSDMWRVIWNTRKSDSLFGQPSVEYTDEQRNLVSWSQMYDNIYEHPDCPEDAIIDDDDILDGWLITQKRKREDDKAKKSIESKVSDKMAGADEIFIVTDSVKGARAVEAMNDPAARALKKAKFDLIEKKGIVTEGEMPDARMKKLQAAANFRKR